MHSSYERESMLRSLVVRPLALHLGALNAAFPRFEPPFRFPQSESLVPGISFLDSESGALYSLRPAPCKTKMSRASLQFAAKPQLKPFGRHTEPAGEGARATFSTDSSAPLGVLCVNIRHDPAFPRAQADAA